MMHINAKAKKMHKNSQYRPRAYQNHAVSTMEVYKQGKDHD